MYRLGGHQCPLLARVCADVGLIAQEKERRQRSACLNLSRRHVLRDREHLYLRVVRQLAVNLWDVSEGGIGGAEVDADVHCRLVINAIRSRPRLARSRTHWNLMLAAAGRFSQLSNPYAATGRQTLC